MALETVSRGEKWKRGKKRTIRKQDDSRHDPFLRCVTVRSHRQNRPNPCSCAASDASYNCPLPSVGLRVSQNPVAKPATQDHRTPPCGLGRGLASGIVLGPENVDAGRLCEDIRQWQRRLEGEPAVVVVDHYLLLALPPVVDLVDVVILLQGVQDGAKSFQNVAKQVVLFIF